MMSGMLKWAMAIIYALATFVLCLDLMIWRP